MDDGLLGVPPVPPAAASVSGDFFRRVAAADLFLFVLIPDSEEMFTFYLSPMP